MELDKILLRRRTMLLSALGATLGVSLHIQFARADSEYPQLDDPPIPVRDPTRVYLVAGLQAGSRLFAAGEHGVIIYSDDAGTNWHSAHVPVSATITSLGFATPQTGWATGGFGVVLGTQDGGKTWVKQLDGIAEISMMNASSQAFAASQPPDSDAAAHALHRAQILAPQGPDKPMLSLLAVSPSEVFAFGTYRFAERSEDGGKSWTDWSMHIGDPLSHNIYGTAIIGGAYYLVAEAGLIFRSTDGGQSFPELAQPADATLFGICDTGGGGILAYGVAGTMYLSSDDGKTWQSPTFTGSANVNTVVAMSSGALLAGDAGGSVWISRDHGHSFTLLLSNSLIAINALLPIDATRFLILSDVGLIPASLSAANG